jgi:HD-like signal output (HDOD) protein
MRFWDMPEELATALRFQHDPAYDGDFAEYPNLVCLSVRLLRSRGIGSGPDEDIPDALLERLGLTRAKAEDVVSKVLEAEVLLRELASQFSQA